MNFPAFWARASEGPFRCWRWSHQSLDDARSLAAEAARKLAARFAAGNMDRAQRYGYGDRPLREPVVREFRDANGERTAVVTRNSYGSYVLNTARLMFVDVDLPETQPTGGLFQRWFGGKNAASESNPARTAVAAAEEWCRRNPAWGWRVYRTRAGLRLVATHALVDSSDSVCQTVFDSFQADPLYRRLCEHQKCFRARLTPKPWRCGIRERPQRWPWDDARQEAKFQQWDARYVKACADFATCRLVGAFGNGAVHPELQPLLAAHDELTRVATDLPLA